MNIHSFKTFICAAIALILVLTTGSGLAQTSKAGKGTAITTQKPLSASLGDAATPNAVNDYQNARWFINVVDHSTDVGAYPSIAYDPKDGSLWVSYYDAAATDLKLAHYLRTPTGNCGPSNTWLCTAIDVSSNDRGRYSSIDIYYNASANVWKLGVSYYDATDKYPRYYEKFQTPSNSGNIMYGIEFHSNVNDDIGKFSSLKYDSAGTPHIAYYGYMVSIGINGLKYAHQVGIGNGNCASSNDWQCDDIDMSSLTYPGYYASLDISWSDVPYIAYYDEIDKDLKYAFLSSPGGNASSNCGPHTAQGYTWTCRTIDSSGDVGKFASLHASQSLSLDRTQIAYYDATNGQLKYAHQIGSGGNCGYNNQWQCDAIDFNIGKFADPIPVGISLGADSDYDPIIAYMDGGIDQAPLSLNIAYPQDNGNCGPGNLIYTWQCSNIDQGGQYANEAGYVSMVIKPGGTAAIAYSELNTYEDKNSLKVAFQEWRIYLPLTKK